VRRDSLAEPLGGLRVGASYESWNDANDPVTSQSSGDHDIEATMRLNRTSGERLTLSGEAGYLNRSGDHDYDGWWLALRARWTP
jgi:hypothetical protein